MRRLRIDRNRRQSCGCAVRLERAHLATPQRVWRHSRAVDDRRQCSMARKRAAGLGGSRIANADSMGTAQAERKEFRLMQTFKHIHRFARPDARVFGARSDATPGLQTLNPTTRPLAPPVPLAIRQRVAFSRFTNNAFPPSKIHFPRQA